jgi:nitrate/nitrite transport system substrate-binding protein
MERRHFLKYGSIGAISLAFSGCKGFRFNNSSPETNSTTGDPFPNPAVNFGNLEKSDLLIGFLPVIGATPLIIAKEKGFFTKYGLNVTLRPQSNWLTLETGLKEYGLDAAQTPFTSPLISQLGKNYAPMIALMVLHRHGSSIILNENAWNSPLRPVRDYFNVQEFAKDFRKYIRQSEEKSDRPKDQPFIYGIDSLTSHNYYLFRYWLSNLGIRTKQEVEWQEFSPMDLTGKLTQGEIEGYFSEAPWDYQSIEKKEGFTVALSQNIWQGHPGSVLSTMIPWVENHPVTARALTCAVLEACQYCDLPEKNAEITQILAQSNYLNLNSSLIENTFSGIYQYGGFDGESRQEEVKDLYLFHHQNVDYLTGEDHANYPWLSHGVWFLTQLIRWQTLELKEYPKDADHKLKKVYPIDIYEEVAKALKIKIPAERMKIESSNLFMDQREFDPSDPVKYLRQFSREL